MRWGFFFFVLLFLGITFEIAEGWADKKWGEVDLFLLIDAKMSPSSYVYYNNETLERILLALFIRYLMSMIDFLKPYRHYAMAFAVLEGIDLIDFWLNGNTLWFEYQGYPITFNVIKFLVFILVIIYDYALDYLTDDPTRDVP